MSRGYQINNPDSLYFVTFTVINWIDVFTRFCYRDIIVDSVNYCIENKGLAVYAWCIMTNHLHLIIGSDKEPLSDIIRDLKKYTSKKIIQEIKRNRCESRKNWMIKLFEIAGKNNSNNKQYQFWQQHNHPIELISSNFIEQKLKYIHNNPVKAGFVFYPEDYYYSSARDYAGKLGLIPVVIIE